MSMINRYEITKMIYPNYLVIVMVEKNRKIEYYTYNIDSDILRYLKFKKSTKILIKNRINYLVLNELDIIEISNYDDNKYLRYQKIVCIDKMLNIIRNRLIGNN